MVTFIHMEQDSLLDWEPYNLVKSNYEKNIKQSKQKTLFLITEMRNNGLNNYADELEKINSDRNSSFIRYSVSKKELRNEYSFFGYPSKRVFLYEIGRSIFSLIPTLLLIIFICNPSIIKELKSFLLVGVLGVLYVCFFWIYHNLFILFDYGNWAYNISYVISALISTILVFSLILYFNYKENEKKKINEALDRLANNGNKLLNLIK